MSCEECNNSEATLYCEDCEQSLCQMCDGVIHKGGKRRSHSRSSLCSCVRESTSLSPTSLTSSCGVCEGEHTAHSPPTAVSAVAVFWDLSSCCPSTPEEIQLVLQELHSSFPNLQSIKAYGRAEFPSVFQHNSVVLASIQGVPPIQAILLDLSICSSMGVSETLILSAQAPSVKPHLQQLTKKIHGLRVQVSLAFPQLAILPLDQLPDPNVPIVIQPRSYFPEQRTGVPPGEQAVILEACPAQQQFVKKAAQNWQHDLVINTLKRVAFSGHLLHEPQPCAALIAGENSMTEAAAAILLRECEELSMIHRTERSFGPTRTGEFIGMKLTSVSLESLLWTLRSLQIDEMLPTERAVQSRMKESFDFKPSSVQWMNLLEAIASKSAAQLLSTPQATDPMCFSLQTYVDPSSGSETQLLYPEGEVWESVDQFVREGDVLQMKNTEVWSVFTQFFEDYFTEGGRLDENKAIPGGRYGCAQFARAFGPEALRTCSLGKLSYMVQLAISDDLFHYQKTLLVWRSRGLKKPQRSGKKLKAVRRAVLDTLKDSGGELSLAQMPQSLKRRLNFPLDLPELGFAKLKDLLNSIPEVSVEMQMTNNPFAVLRQALSEDLVKSNVRALLRQHPWGIDGEKAERFLANRLGRSVHWPDYHCNSIYDFTERMGYGVLKNGKSQNQLIIKGCGSLERVKSSSATGELYADYSLLSSPPEEEVNQESGVVDFDFQPHRDLIENLLSDKEEDPQSCFIGQSLEFLSTASFEGLWERHGKAHSQDFSHEKTMHSRQVRSYYDGFSDNPPPGFEM